MENIIEEEWNDEKAIDYLISLSHEISMGHSEMASAMKIALPNLKELPPIGIYFNNKIIEMYRFVKNSKVIFSDSYCVTAVETYLMKLVNDSIEVSRQFLTENRNKNDERIDKLQELYDRLEELKNVQGIKKLTVKSKYNKIKKEYNTLIDSKDEAVHLELLDQYTDICNQILNFSIENDIDTAINYQIDLCINDEEYNDNINDIIDVCNEELSLLGIEKVIEHRDSLEKPKAYVKK